MIDSRTGLRLNGRGEAIGDAEAIFGDHEWDVAAMDQARLENRAATGDGEAALRDAKAIGDRYQRDNAIASVAVGMAREGDHEGACSAVMESRTVVLRVEHMGRLARAQIDRGAVAEARISARRAREMIEGVDSRLNRGVQSHWLAQILAGAGLLYESAALTTQIAENYAEFVYPGFEIDMALALR